MKISEYIKNYTLGKRIRFKHVMWEVRELLLEIFKFNKKGIKEEFEDVFHFLQLWIFWRFKIDGEIWKITKHSVQKFIDRKTVWNEIYIYVGLEENISGYVGNYKKSHKVIAHLEKFGVSKEKAEECYNVLIKER